MFSGKGEIEGEGLGEGKKECSLVVRVGFGRVDEVASVFPYVEVVLGEGLSNNCND